MVKIFSLFLAVFSVRIEAFMMSKPSAVAIPSKALASDEPMGKPTQDWDVKRYQDQHSFVWKYGSSLVDLLQVKPGERILDIGCGSGELTAAIAEASDGIEAIGMDSDASMVSRAREQFRNLSFFQGDVRSFVLKEPVDVIFSNAALHWVPPSDVESSVIAMSNAIRSDGRFVVEFGGKGNVQKIIEAVQEEVPGVESPWYFPSISEYTRVLEEHGIEVLSAALFDRPTPLEDKDDGIMSWLRMFGNAFFEGKGEEEIDLALDRVQTKLKPHLHDGDQWNADYRRIRIVGRTIT